MCAKSIQPYPTLCDPMDHNPAGSSAHGILQARILERVAVPSSRRSSQPRDQTHISYISCAGRQILYHYCHLGYNWLYSNIKKKTTQMPNNTGSSAMGGHLVGKKRHVPCFHTVHGLIGKTSLFIRLLNKYYNYGRVQDT